MPSLSLYSDRGETELARHEAQAKEALRLDVLAMERLVQLDREAGHVRHLEQLIAEHEVELERQTAAQAAIKVETRRAFEASASATAKAEETAAEAVRECGRLERAIEAQERIIAYRQSVRWWLALPWLRIRLAWNRWRSR